jgi:hypothetical protein
MRALRFAVSILILASLATATSARADPVPSELADDFMRLVSAGSEVVLYPFTTALDWLGLRKPAEDSSVAADSQKDARRAANALTVLGFLAQQQRSADRSSAVYPVRATSPQQYRVISDGRGGYSVQPW